jgi:hypothetical protein
LTQLEAKFAALESLDESRTVTRRMTYQSRVNTSGQLIEDLLRVVIRKGGELLIKRLLLCWRNAFRKAKDGSVAICWSRRRRTIRCPLHG